jgi:hypothetical protein
MLLLQRQRIIHRELKDGRRTHESAPPSCMWKGFTISNTGMNRWMHSETLLIPCPKKPTHERTNKSWGCRNPVCASPVQQSIELCLCFRDPFCSAIKRRSHWIGNANLIDPLILHCNRRLVIDDSPADLMSSVWSGWINDMSRSTIHSQKKLLSNHTHKRVQIVHCCTYISN